MEEERINPDLEKFLDAESFEDKLDVFYGLRYKVDDFMLTTIAMSLDIELTKETLEEKYEGARLRR